jgi:hypothetical protein
LYHVYNPYETSGRRKKALSRAEAPEDLDRHMPRLLQGSVDHGVESYQAKIAHLLDASWSFFADNVQCIILFQCCDCDACPSLLNRAYWYALII